MIITIAQLRPKRMLTDDQELTPEFQSMLISAIEQFNNTPEAHFGHRYDGSEGEPIEVFEKGEYTLIRIRETGTRQGRCARCDESCDYC